VPAPRGLGVVILVVVAGLVVGSLLGELLGYLLPSGWLQELFTRGPTIGLTSPMTIDLRLLSLTFGLAFKVNLVGVLGIVIAALALRRL
jgi:ABC-type dipeptide/oligopeptide/nickel transport system permease subunit